METGPLQRGNTSEGRSSATCVRDEKVGESQLAAEGEVGKGKVTTQKSETRRRKEGKARSLNIGIWARGEKKRRGPSKAHEHKQVEKGTYYGKKRRGERESTMGATTKKGNIERPGRTHKGVVYVK